MDADLPEPQGTEETPIDAATQEQLAQQFTEFLMARGFVSVKFSRDAPWVET